jgi:hypothetical protein
MHVQLVVKLTSLAGLSPFVCAPPAKENCCFMLPCCGPWMLRRQEHWRWVFYSCNGFHEDAPQVHTSNIVHVITTSVLSCST